MTCQNCDTGPRQYKVRQSAGNSLAKEHGFCGHCLTGWMLEWVFLNEHSSTPTMGDALSPIRGKFTVEKIDLLPGLPGDQVSEPGQTGTIRT